MTARSAQAEALPPPVAVPSEPSRSAPGPKPLSFRQEKFCEHYALVGNAAEAARQAGYAERSAKNHGSRLLGDARIRDRIYAIRVNRAMKFGPVMAFARLESLFFKATEKGDIRAAARILTLQARLAGVESWMPPSVVAREAYKPRRRRGALGVRGADPFDNLSESCGIGVVPPEIAERMTTDDDE